MSHTDLEFRYPVAVPSSTGRRLRHVRKRILSSIERIAKTEALAGKRPREPLIVTKTAANAEHNDPALTARMSGRLLEVLGREAVVEIPAKMVFEDFAKFALAGVP